MLICIDICLEFVARGHVTIINGYTILILAWKLADRHGWKTQLAFRDHGAVHAQHFMS